MKRKTKLQESVEETRLSLQSKIAELRESLKPRVDLLPWKALLICGKIMAWNLEKYPEPKWKTISMDDHLASASRHLAQLLNGETDEDHLAHLACRVLMALARRP